MIAPIVGSVDPANFQNVTLGLADLGFPWLIFVFCAAVATVSWIAAARARREAFARLFFHSSDRSRRKSEMRLLLLAVGLGLVIALGAAAAIYVLNVTHRI
jgi:hypothetical protein